MSPSLRPFIVASLSPPYPNLGPEPLVEPRGLPSPSLILVVPAALVLALAIGTWIRSRIRRSRSRAGRSKRNGVAVRKVITERDRIAAAGDRVREGLAARFGTTWHARTTEEILASPEIVDALPSTTRAELATLLRLADLAKFAGPSFDARHPESSDQGEGIDWLAVADGLVRVVVELTPGLSAGATSNSTGR
ncbi:MAG: hypothetical protein U0794_16315 [Isosphaeraceae bacterium]